MIQAGRQQIAFPTDCGHVQPLQHGDHLEHSVRATPLVTGEQAVMLSQKTQEDVDRDRLDLPAKSFQRQAVDPGQ